MLISYLLLLWLFVSVYVSDGANILFLSPMASKSHKFFFMGIVKALGEKGHNVTILSAFKNSKEIKNVNDVALPELDFMSILSIVYEEYGAIQMYKNLIINSPYICNRGLALKQVQDLKKEKFDLILISMFYDFCYLSFVHHFKVPFIFVSPIGLHCGPFAQMSGSLQYSSFVANKLQDANFPLTFIDRIMTLGLNTVFSLATSYYMYPKSEEICRTNGLCPSDMPAFSEFNQNASLTILNSVRGLENPPRPSMPNVIYAGGIHVRPGEQLSEDLESWVQGAGKFGFIYFCLGSALKPSDMPKRHQRTLIKVFGSLPQRVLWKWDEETMPDLPPNVRLGKWLPQQDILAHNKLRLFITHGGLYGMLEATFNGVPIIGMPLFADQFSNMKEAVSEGWARIVNWNELTESSLKSSINEILNNASYAKVARQRSLIMKDLPMHPAEEASFWVEFVLRHGGAKHMTSPLFQVSWYELHNIDVLVSILIMISVNIFITYLLFKWLMKQCFGKGNLSSKTKRKKD